MPSRLSWLTLFQSSATITYIEHVWKQQTVILLNLGPSSEHRKSQCYVQTWTESVFIALQNFTSEIEDRTLSSLISKQQNFGNYTKA